MIFFHSQFFHIFSNLSVEKENIIKDKRTLFRQKIEPNHTAIKDMKNLFRLKKEIESIEDRILRDIKNLFENEIEELNYYKPVKVNNFYCNNLNQ